MARRGSAAGSSGSRWRAVRRGIVPRRLAGAVLVVWGAASLAFLMLKAIPGDPVDVILGPLASTATDVREQIRADLGLNLPLWQQYIEYLGRLLRGDFGTSYQQQRPVLEVIAQQAPSTLQLAGFALLLAVLVSVALALYARSVVARRLAIGFELLAAASPVFWTALLFSALFSFQLRWFPIGGENGIAGLVLPGVTLALPAIAVLSPVLRGGIEEAAGEVFAESARARGVGPNRLAFRHGLRHAAGPGVTLAGYIFGLMLGGAVLVETIFARPGLGRVTLDAVLGRDLPVVMALVVLSAIIFVLLNLVVDLFYPVIDPRRRERAGSAAGGTTASGRPVRTRAHALDLISGAPR